MQICAAIRVVHALVLMLTALLGTASVTFADLVNNDLLLGIGDFERSTYVRWFASYSGSDYDYAADPLMLYYVLSPGQKGGYSKPAPDNYVGDGWLRVTGKNVNPRTNAAYRLESMAGMGSGNSQLIALKGMTSGFSDAYIDRHIQVLNNKPWCVHTGDTVTFEIDRIMMTDYSDLPANTALSFYMQLGSLAPAKELTPSIIPFSSQISATVPQGVTDINLQIYVTASGNLGSRQPGVRVDGAHLYVKRAGTTDYEKHEVPVLRQRGIKTQNVAFRSTLTDIYAAARDYDSIVLPEDEYYNVAVLRILNPKIRVYVYQSGAMCLDRRDATGHDDPFKSAPFTYLEVSKDHPEWLYSGANGAIHDPTYRERYPLKITNPDYQRLGADRIIELARKLRVDGVWLDDLGALRADAHAVDRAQWEVQQFVHAVCPKLRSAGLEIIQNAAGVNIQNVPDWVGNNGVVCFDPSWAPNASYRAAAGYSANGVDNTSDTFFQEWAFLAPVTADKNTYDRAYWYRCLQDMGTIEAWNTRPIPLLSPDQKRHLHMWVTGRDFATDPAYGRDGWISFGLCSYLLGQNDWTYFGAQIKDSSSSASYPNIDYSITKKLGAADGPHLAYNSDTYCRYRRYKSTADGGVGGVVVVNGNTALRTYKLSIDALDENGKFLARGSVVMLKPHTGRIFLQQKNNILVTIGSPPAGAKPGQVVTITVSYLNDGNTEARSAVVSAMVPDTMTYIVGSGGTYNSATRTVRWTIPLIAAHANGRKTLKVRYNRAVTVK